MKKIFFIFSIIILGYFCFTPATSGEGIKDKNGKITISWSTTSLRVCPPGIFGTQACEYPDIKKIAQQFIGFILEIAPLSLVILIIMGGFIYMLSTFKPDIIKTGHRYIQWAVYGYIILLLITLIFTFVQAIFGGPGF